MRFEWQIYALKIVCWCSILDIHLGWYHSITTWLLRPAWKNNVFSATHIMTTWRLTVLRLATNKICSECSSTNNNWLNSQSLAKKYINSSGVHKTKSNQCPRVKLIKKQQTEINIRFYSSAPISVNHCLATTHVNLGLKISFINV